ncbi:outer membrane beta-barrel family protein [uncultured Imperialibacter sp.]|uniref:outer membrane beta-barrel family protein n=1 Tax=uncultured Imperialibacter sp. TaxID=1672639 RepID=UPI0030DD46C4|tara:strand:- start:277059 stop:279500 length:2442 start_codon:yes stop_codon:yes gene_type:complete
MNLSRPTIFFIAGLILFTSADIAAQKEGGKADVVGKIVDAGSGDPLEFATVSFYTPDSSLVSGVVTDLQGQFKIELAPGSYYSLVQFVSYEDKYFSGITLAEGQKRMNLGTIAVEADSETLQEVVVEAERSQMEMSFDKRIFNVSKDPSNVGRTATQLLDNVPSVTVDTDGNVALRGSQNVRILIDGKPSGLVGISGSNGLQSLQGSLIESIEVVTNPSVRYQAEGSAGIINIVLKKDDRNGVNGSFELNAGYPANYGASANVNFRREKINYFVNYGANYRESPGGGSSFQRYTLPDTSFITRRTEDRTRGGWAHNLRAGADFFVTPKDIITVSGVVRYEDGENVNNLIYEDFNSNDVLQNRTGRVNTEQENELNSEVTLNYERSFDDKDRKLTAYAQFRDNNESEDADIEQRLLGGEDPEMIMLRQRSLNDETERNLLVQSDYVHPFSKDGKFEAGFRSTFRQISTNYLVEEQDSVGTWNNLVNFTNDFRYTENVHAVYGLIANRHGKVSYQAGLRAELSDIQTLLLQTDETNNRLYANLFPSIHANYHLNETHSWQVSYSRRISRPRFRELNPFSSFSDARNIRTGNPNLNPEFTNSYEIGYLVNGKTSTVYAGVYNRRTSDVSQRVNYVDADGVTFSQPLNLAFENAFGVESNISKDWFDWWTSSLNFNFYRRIIEGDFNGEPLNADTYTWSGRVNSRVTLWKKVNYQVNAFYRAPQNTPQGERLAYYAIDMGLNRDILNGNGTINLSVRDILNSRKWRGITQGETFYQESEFQWRSRQFMVSFVYRLNQKKRGGGREEREDFEGGEGDF